jgi:hypothetical protein
MGLMDRVKAQASSLAQQANQGMAKLDNLPAQRRADSLLRGLGVAVLADRTGRAAADNEARISQILTDLAQHEQQYNVDLVQQAAQAQAQQAQQQWQGPGGFPQSPGGFQPQPPGGFQPQPPGGFQPQPPGGFQPQPPGGYPQAPGGFPEPPGGYQQSGFPQPPGGGYQQPDPGDDQGQSGFPSAPGG